MQISRPSFRKLLALTVLLTSGAVLFSVRRPAPTARAAAPAPPITRAAFAQLPLGVEPNLGQLAPSVRFSTRGDGYQMFFTDTETVLGIRNAEWKTDDVTTGVQIPHCESSDLHLQFPNSRSPYFGIFADGVRQTNASLSASSGFRNSSFPLFRIPHSAFRISFVPPAIKRSTSRCASGPAAGSSDCRTSFGRERRFQSACQCFTSSTAAR